MARRRLRFRRRRIGRRYRRTFRRSFAKKVKSVMYRASECKNSAFSINTLINDNITYIEMVPSIGQGPGDNQRIGNKIMSRNFQLKLTITCNESQNPTAAQLVYFRMYIVWPRKFSRTDAIAAATAGNFPLFGVVDQDNWIIWKDMRWQMSSNPTVYQTYKQTMNITFNKRFFAGLEYRAASATFPNKGPLIVIVNNQDVLQTQLLYRGYTKLSYKDI